MLWMGQRMMPERSATVMISANLFCCGGVFILDFFIFILFFFFCSGCVARSLGARFLGFSARFWLLGFLGFLVFGFWASYSCLVLYGLLASWFPWLLGFSASRLVGLSTSLCFVYYIILCCIKLYSYTHTHIYILLYYLSVYCI